MRAARRVDPRQRWEILSLEETYQALRTSSPA
jgi:hypothetical protein